MQKIIKKKFSYIKAPLKIGLYELANYDSQQQKNVSNQKSVHFIVCSQFCIVSKPENNQQYIQRKDKNKAAATTTTASQPMT